MFLDSSELSAGSTNAPGNSDDLPNLNNLDGNVIVITSNDFRTSIDSNDNGFPYYFFQAICPYEYVQYVFGIWVLNYNFIITDSIFFAVELILFYFNMPNWEVLMDFEAEYYKGCFTGISADVDGN